MSSRYEESGASLHNQVPILKEEDRWIQMKSTADQQSMPRGSARSTPSRTQESRRISVLLIERRASSMVAIATLGSALVLGIVGLAIHILWIAAVVVLALGFGFVIANGRRNRIEAVSKRQEMVDLAKQS